MKTIQNLTVLLINFVFFSAIHGTFQDIIKQNIKYPKKIISLLDKYDTEEVKNYRDSRYNNLMHLTVQELVKQKNDIKNLQDICKDFEELLLYLDSKGISVNEVNDDHATPCFLALRENNDIEVLGNFMVIKLKGLITYSSFSPELRKTKRFIESQCSQKSLLIIAPVTLLLVYYLFY